MKIRLKLETWMLLSGLILYRLAQYFQIHVSSSESQQKEKSFIVAASDTSLMPFSCKYQKITCQHWWKELISSELHEFAELEHLEQFVVSSLCDWEVLFHEPKGGLGESRNMFPPKSWDCAPCPCSWDYLSCDSVDMCSSTDSRINAGQRHHFCLTRQHKCVHWTQSKVERLLITQEVVGLPQRVWNNQTDWSEVLDRMTSNTNQQIQSQWDLIALITSWTGWCPCYCAVFWINATFTDLLLFLLTVNSGSCVHTSSGGSLCRAFSQNRIILLVAVRKCVMLTATQIYSSSSSVFTTGVRFYSTLLYSNMWGPWKTTSPLQVQQPWVGSACFQPMAEWCSGPPPSLQTLLPPCCSCLLSPRETCPCSVPCELLPL